MEKENKEITFGAKDSELYKFEYTIPEGYEARIEDGKVIMKKKESKDERIMKEIVDFIYWAIDRGSITNEQRERSDSWLAYLEKQKEQIQTEVERKYVRTIKCLIDDFIRRNKIEVGRWYYQNIYDWLDGRHIEQNYNKYTQKPAEWSEEDERMVEIAEECATNKDFVFETLEKQLSFLDWLKSLPKRFNLQPKQEWSEEDEKMIDKCIELVFFAMPANISAMKTKEQCLTWLKSFRLQPHWKPSEYQMKALYSLVFDGGITYVSQLSYLKSLYEDLKSL